MPSQTDVAQCSGATRIWDGSLGGVRHALKALLSAQAGISFLISLHGAIELELISPLIHCYQGQKAKD